MDVLKKVCNHSEPLTETWFSFMRSEGYPTRYGDQFSTANVDVLTSGIITGFVILGLCFYLILPGFSRKRRWSLFAYVTVSLFIGGVIVGGNFGSNWEVGHVAIRSQYKPGSAEEIDAYLGLHIQLRGVNITFRGLDDGSGSKKWEGINYNEHFSWEWDQGRFGFGKYAGRFNRDFRSGVLKGLPYPILQTAEYFTFDGEGIRFGRHYRLAGWYAHIMMWTAFPMWIISNILFASTVPSGAFCLGVTGILQLIAIGIWTFLRNPFELGIPFEASSPHHKNHEDKEVILRTVFGADYYLVFLNGLLCVILGFTLWLLTEIMPDEICNFFGIDPLTSYDEYLPSQDEIDKQKRQKSFRYKPAKDVEKGETQPLATFTPTPESPTYGAAGDSLRPPETDICDENATVLKRRATGKKKFQTGIKNLGIKPHIAPRKKSNVSNVRYHKPGSITIEEENDKEVSTPLMGPPHEEDEDDHYRDYANLPPVSRPAHKKY